MPAEAVIYVVCSQLATGSASMLSKSFRIPIRVSLVPHDVVADTVHRRSEPCSQMRARNYPPGAKPQPPLKDHQKTQRLQDILDRLYNSSRTYPSDMEMVGSGDIKAQVAC